MTRALTSTVAGTVAPVGMTLDLTSGWPLGGATPYTDADEAGRSCLDAPELSANAETRFWYAPDRPARAPAIAYEGSRSGGIATTSYELVEILATNVVSPAEPPRGPGDTAVVPHGDTACRREGAHRRRRGSAARWKLAVAGVDVLPWSPTPDHLRLVQADHRLGEGVVVRVADVPLAAGLGGTLRVPDREVR